MKKTLAILCAMLLLGVVAVSARGDWSTIQKSGLRTNWDTVKPTSVYSPSSIWGGYTLGKWVQMSDDQITEVTAPNKGFSHRFKKSTIDDAPKVNQLLCDSWKLTETECQYHVDDTGRIHFVSLGHKWRGKVLL